MLRSIKKGGLPINRGNRNFSLDSFRLVAATIVIMIHTYPLESFTPLGNFILVHIMGRIAVPFFIIMTGYSLFGDGGKRSNFKQEKRIKVHLFKNLKIYVWASLLYLPLAIYSGVLTKSTSIFHFLKLLLFDGVIYHLWYFPGIILGVILFDFLRKNCSMKIVVFFCLGLYLIGLGGDSYSGLAFQIPLIKNFYTTLFEIFSFTRNGLFMMPVFLLLGAKIYDSKEVNQKYTGWGFLISFSLLLIEGSLLGYFSKTRHDSMYLFLIPTMYFLFKFVASSKLPKIKNSSSLALSIYLIHPAVIVFVRIIGQVLNVENIVIKNSLGHFLVVWLLSMFFSLILLKVLSILKVKNTVSQERVQKTPVRAWKELSEANLIGNMRKLETLMESKTEMMAVIKADAYGHGAVTCAKILGDAGCKIFAVATLKEAVELREAGIYQDILILSGTSDTDIQEIQLIQHYDLIQTIVDFKHGQALGEYHLPIRCHISLDTGMHREGLNSDNVEEIVHLYQDPNLLIEGIYSHLGSADSQTKLGKERTKKQISHFNEVLKNLKNQGIDVGKTHLQSSYGLLNYPELCYDYVRIGIALYGCLSEEINHPKVQVDLKPVLSLKSQVVSIRSVKPGQVIGYSEEYTANKKMKLALVGIGYADGVPRTLSNNNFQVLIKGQAFPVVGRVCMDMLIVDISREEQVTVGNEVVLIGQSQHLEQKAEEVARLSGTITNELLSRLGRRLVAK